MRERLHRGLPGTPRSREMRDASARNPIARSPEASFPDADTARGVINSVGSVKTGMRIADSARGKVRSGLSSSGASSELSNAVRRSHASRLSDILESHHESPRRLRFHGNGAPRNAANPSTTVDSGSLPRMLDCPVKAAGSTSDFLRESSVFCASQPLITLDMRNGIDSRVRITRRLC